MSHIYSDDVTGKVINSYTYGYRYVEVLAQATPSYSMKIRDQAMYYRSAELANTRTTGGTKASQLF